MKTDHPHSSTNLWQRGVPIETPLLTPATLLLFVLGGMGLTLSIIRMGGSLRQFSGMNDVYAWGVWKTFNVMTLTALGSGGLAVGMAAWVFDRKRLHVVMRTALVTSFLFYATGLIALAIDVGRPWNFYNLLIPTRWNGHSPLFEVAFAMPVYCALFLLFENSPAIVERFWYRGSPRARRFIKTWQPRMRRIYPYMIAGAYVFPLGHQSSLGALLLLAGNKLDPLWQTPILPLLYLVQAFGCGFSFMIFILMASCITWKRPLDMDVISELANMLSWTSIVWLVLRFGDIALRGQLASAFQLSPTRALFWLENFMVLIPALRFRDASARRTPRIAFRMAVTACVGGMLYRFTPTTLTFNTHLASYYFPTVAEVVMSAGFICLAFGAFTIAVKMIAILPAPLANWFQSIEIMRAQTPGIERDRYGNPIDN